MYRKTMLSEIKEMSQDYDMSSKHLASVWKDSDKNLLKFNTRTSHYYNQESLLKETKSQSFADNKEFFINVNQINHINTMEPKKKKNKKEKVKTIRQIQDLAGLIKIKFDWKNYDVPGYFQPWDCPAIKETKLSEICKNFDLRKKLSDFCRNSFLKVYPSFKRFDSSNFDPVKSWICGVQIAAMNVQSLAEDHMLINTIFFKINKNCGYVLKPNFLRQGYEYDRNYLKPVEKLTLEIISGSMLFNCMKNQRNLSEISINCYIVGSWEDDNFNIKFQSKKYKKNLINPIFDNETYLFDVYETVLSFIIIKIISKDEIIARACIPLKIVKEGIRVVPLYDEMCKEVSDSELIVRVARRSI